MPCTRSMAEGGRGNIEKGCWGNGGENVGVVESVEEEEEGRKDGSTRNVFESMVTEAAAFKSLPRAQ